MKAPELIILALSLQVFASIPAYAQSWSAWKQLAEEQEKNAQFAQAEDSWRKAYQMIKESGSRDPRLYISALRLAQTLVSQSKSDQAQLILKEACSNDVAPKGPVSEEQLACCKTHLELCKNTQNTGEAERVAALIGTLSKQKSTMGVPAEKQVSLLFGEAAKADLYKELGQVKALIKQKDYAAVERKLNDALEIARATHDHEIMSLILREQGKFYCITKEYKQAEVAFRNLSEIVKQDAGPESLSYIAVLGSHARLLHLLGDDKQAAVEQAKCEAISDRYKITPFAQQEQPGMQGFASDFAASSNNSGAAAGRNRSFGNANNRFNNPPVTASANTGQSAPRISGRLRVIEFYAVW